MTQNQPTYTAGLLFTQAHKAVRVRIVALLEGYGLTPSYWAILGIAASAVEGVRSATVARQMDVKAPLITMVVNDLITMGLITRVPHHTDGRAKLLVVTPKGKKMAGEIEGKLAQEIHQLLHGATASDIAAFQKTLEIIVANAATH